MINRTQIKKNSDGDLTLDNKVTITIKGGMDKSAVLVETAKRVMRSHFGNVQRVDGYECSDENDTPITMISSYMTDDELLSAWEEIRSLAFGLRYFLDTAYTPVDINGSMIMVGVTA